MWNKGEDWRVVGSLGTLYNQIRRYAPRSIPPATNINAWGAIADDAHSASSDHYPHYYSALGPTAVVCARDFPHAPGLGLDAAKVTESLRLSRDPRIGYIIFNRRITGPSHGWQWDPYFGDDPHDTHFHVSTVHTPIADSTASWSLPGGATVMASEWHVGEPNGAGLTQGAEGYAGQQRDTALAFAWKAASDAAAAAATANGKLDALTVKIDALTAAVGALAIPPGAYEPAELKQFAKDGAMAAQKEIATAVGEL